MLWFEGSIPDAIISAKQQSCVFVVVISGEDEQSAQLMSSWEDDSVSEAAQNCCVAIKVDAKSETCVQFSEIYPVVCIPSSFFIGENGIPLEVIAGSVSAEELTKRINRVKQMHVQHSGVLPGANAPVETRPCECTATEPAPAPATPSAPAWPALSDTTELAAVPGTNKGDDGSPTLAENASSDDAQCSQGEEDLDAQMERLTKKLEEKQEQRKIGEENEIKREMERRKVGKDMQDLKRKQEEEKTKRLREERIREKAEEKAARERVKQQIALDRADRAARYAKTQEEENAAKMTLLHAKQAEQEVRKEAVLRERSTKARIQFRLPDGSSFTNQFHPQSKLQEARHFAVQIDLTAGCSWLVHPQVDQRAASGTLLRPAIVQLVGAHTMARISSGDRFLEEVGNRYGNFSLATMFPRREFTSEDLQKTLLELELAPSASIVLLPQSGRPGHAVVQSSEGGIWAVLGTLLYPLLAVWRFLSSFLFANPRPRGAASSGSSLQSNSYINSDSDKAKRETLSKHNLEKRPNDFKKDGKICRLRTQDDSEDDNNTWNGNSTQQM